MENRFEEISSQVKVGDGDITVFEVHTLVLKVLGDG